MRGNDEIYRLWPFLSSKLLNSETKPCRNQLRQTLPSESSLHDLLLRQVFIRQLPNLLAESAASHALPGRWTIAKKALPSPPSYHMHTHVIILDLAAEAGTSPQPPCKLFSCRLCTSSFVWSKSVVNRT